MAAKKKRTKNAEPKIVSLIPRVDSVHAYFEEEDDDGESTVINMEVIAWGLRSDGTVTGLIAPDDEATNGALEPVDDLVHFMGYAGPGSHKAFEERLDAEDDNDEDEDEGED
jgi:hypothetical protein